MSAQSPRLLVIVNPNASRAAEALPQISEWFSNRAGVLVLTSNNDKELKRALRKHAQGADRIVLGGGDGTLSNALPELLQLNKPLAVLPLGTANDFARTIGLSADPVEAAEIALNGREHRIDVGLANDKPYLNVASVGVASQVTEVQSKELKRRWHVLAYALALLRAARALQPFFVHLEIDDGPKWSAAVYQVSVANGRHHGGGLTVADDAAIDDGTLHLYIVYPGTFWQLFACLTHLRFGLMKPRVLGRHTAVRVMLRTDRPRPVDIDGTLATKTPAEFTVLRQALTVILPRALHENHRGLVGVERVGD